MIGLLNCEVFARYTHWGSAWHGIFLFSHHEGFELHSSFISRVIPNYILIQNINIKCVVSPDSNLGCFSVLLLVLVHQVISTSYGLTAVQGRFRLQPACSMKTYLAIDARHVSKTNIASPSALVILCLSSVKYIDQNITLRLEILTVIV